MQPLSDILAHPPQQHPRVTPALGGVTPRSFVPFAKTVFGSKAPTSLFGLDLVNATRAEAARAIVSLAGQRQPATLQFVNAHCINMALRDAEYRRALAQAGHLLPDGSGIATAARLAGEPMGENLNGTDLFPEICRHAAEAGHAIHLLGGRPGIAAAAASAMRACHPSLQIAGTRNGYWAAAEEERLIAEINASGADILMVGLGVPLQEKWIARVRPHLTAKVVIGVGGLFDYYSGAIPRAPMILRKTGFEWVWRLMQEPKRLFGRYILGNPVFLRSAAAYAWRQRGIGELLSQGLKRRFDFLASLLALTALSPLFLMIALAIKLEDRGPVFFRQTRIGHRGQPFRMWKFRSMVIDAEARLAAIMAQSERDGTCFKMRRDPRITRIGAFLRRFSLDELPQLFNILAGDMSVVGPRPALPREVLTYAPEQRERLIGLPGLTCTWQVSGRAEIPFEQQVVLDVEYLRTRSFAKDMEIIVRTIPAVLNADGAY